MFGINTKTSGYSLAGIAAMMLLAAGCSTAPSTNSGRDELSDNVNSTLARLNQDDPDFRGFLNSAYGYAIFPTAGKGGVVVAGAYGRGEVFEQGRFIGFADISQATIGAQIGGQSFTEAIAFETPAALERFKAGQLAFDANASAVALKSGAASSAKYTNGVAVFVEPVAGLMAEAAVGGQSFSFRPSNQPQP